MHIIFLITLTMFKDMPINVLPVFRNRIQMKSEENQKPKLWSEHFGVGHLRYVHFYKYTVERKQNTQINMLIGSL